MGLGRDYATPPAKSGHHRLIELKRAMRESKLRPTSVPGATARVGTYGTLEPAVGRALYRLLSAYAHGMQWQALTASLARLDDAAPVLRGTLVWITGSDTLSIVATDLAIDTASAMLDDLERYRGTLGDSPAPP